MTQHGYLAEFFREALAPEFRDGELLLPHLETYLRATNDKTEAQQALLHRAYGVYLAYYEVREQLDAALGEIVAHERHHEGDTDVS